MIRRVLSAVLDWLTPAPLDLGLPEPTTVRECHADDTLAVFTDEDRFGLTAAMDLAPSRQHEGTADERMRRVR